MSLSFSAEQDCANSTIRHAADQTLLHVPFAFSKYPKTHVDLGFYDKFSENAGLGMVQSSVPF